MKYIVYQVTNKVNGKLYIGVHKTENPDIFDGYIGNGIKIGYSITNPKTAYQYALKKYGYDSFIRTTLKVFDTIEEALDLEAKLVTSEFVKQDNNYNITVGGGGYPIFYKTIYQFNSRKELVNKFEGISSVGEFYGLNKNKIWYAINNKKILMESYFSYSANPNFDEYSKYINYNLYQFSNDGVLLGVFENTKDCSNKLNLSFKSLETAVTEKKKYKNNYWTHDPDNIFNIIKINKLFALENGAIQQFDINNNYIQEFNSITEASKILNIKYGTIKSAISKNSLVDNKFYFRKVAIITKHTKIGQYDYNTGELIKVWDSIAQCAKIHPKAREVVKGQRNQTHGYTFKYMD